MTIPRLCHIGLGLILAAAFVARAAKAWAGTECADTTAGWDKASFVGYVLFMTIVLVAFYFLGKMKRPPDVR